jgi:hypothetical protein
VPLFITLSEFRIPLHWTNSSSLLFSIIYFIVTLPLV